MTAATGAGETFVEALQRASWRWTQPEPIRRYPPEPELCILRSVGLKFSQPRRHVDFALVADWQCLFGPHGMYDRDKQRVLDSLVTRKPLVGH